jgi:hypothetical protein
MLNKERKYARIKARTESILMLVNSGSIDLMQAQKELIEINKKPLK